MGVEFVSSTRQAHPPIFLQSPQISVLCWGTKQAFLYLWPVEITQGKITNPLVWWFAFIIGTCPSKSPGSLRQWQLLRQKFVTARLCLQLFPAQPVTPVNYKTRERELEPPSKGSSLPPLGRDTMVLRTILTSSSHKEAGATVESEITLAG